MSVGHKYAFPRAEVRLPDGQCTDGGAEGMSYREWLIGQALSGVAMVSQTPNACAIDCIGMADAIIVRLDAEAKP